MWMGLHSAARKYKLRPSTLRKMLRCIDHRIRQAGKNTWIEIQTSSLEKFCNFWNIGAFNRDISKLNYLELRRNDEYLTLGEAEKLFKIPYHTIYMAIKRGRLQAVKSPVNKWMVRISDIQLYAKKWMAHHNTKHEPNHLWIYRPTKRQIVLLNELLDIASKAKRMAERRNLPLDKNWIGTLIHEIHEREKNRSM